MKIVTVGSDPEFFVLDRKGKAYPATPFAVGTKEHPEPILSLGPGFFEQRDNLSFEGNIPPAHTKEEFIKYVTALREYFINKVAKFGCGISSNGVEYFPKRMLITPEGSEFGCSSVVSAWDSSQGNRIMRPTPMLSGFMYRVSGFHIHIGIKKEDKDPALSWDILLGRLFDIFLTMPSHKIKDEPERLLTYGKYGMIRSKIYGVECRTLSTFFTQPIWLGWVWDQLMKMESFIALCSENDLRQMIVSRYFVTDQSSIVTALSDIFSEFENKEILNQFDETKIIDIKPKKTTFSNFNSYYVGSYTTSNSTSGIEW